MKTALQVFKDRWQDGCGHEQCDRAYKVCLFRGRVPCDVLFVGEAPGPSEDSIGLPFVGPAGKLLDYIIDQSGLPQTHSYALCNLVGCMPRGTDGMKSGEPDVDQVDACKERLEEFITLCAPRLVVCVGKMAAEWLERGIKGNVVFDAHAPREVKKLDILHPAAILRASVAVKDMQVQRCIVQLSNAIEEL